MLGTKQNTLTSGDNILISGNAISALGYVYHTGDTSYATKYYRETSSGEKKYYNNTSSGIGAFAQGFSTQATAQGAHTEGTDSIANALNAHAEGMSTASGQYSHSEGWGTTASGLSQHVQGQWNVIDTTSAFIIGNGNNSVNRSNAFKVDKTGNTWMAGSVTATGLQIGSTTLSEAQLIELIKLIPTANN